MDNFVLRRTVSLMDKRVFDYSTGFWIFLKWISKAFNDSKGTEGALLIIRTEFWLEFFILGKIYFLSSKSVQIVKNCKEFVLQN